MRLIRSAVIAISLLGGPPAGIQPAFAREAAVVAAASAEAERAGAAVTIRWQGLGSRVRVWQLPAPDARRGQGQLLATLTGGANGGGAGVVVPAAISPRPWFLLQDERGRQLRVAERVLPLAGGMNFRDLGGYAGAGGKPVRWGVLYRSAVMAGLTAEDFQYLTKLGIRTVCDFRANGERSREPVAWPAASAPKVLTRDYELDIGPLMAAFRGGDVTPEQARTAMAGFYRQLPYNFAGDYRAMFAELLAQRVPLAFNCSAGKDRTGMAAVLILLALGVDRETAIADYLLSNRHYRPQPPKPGAPVDPSMAMFARLPPAVAQALMGVERAYIEASLAEIEARGGLDRYFSEQLGIGAGERARLQALYLAD
jgi:protein-tyrosine phosphatase